MVSEIEVEVDIEVEISLHVLHEEFAWFAQVLDTRMKLFMGKPGSYASIQEILPPKIGDAEGFYARFLQHYVCTAEERLLIILCLAPILAPQLLDVFFTKNALYDRPFTEFGGQRGTTHSGFLPTAETALFLLADNDLGVRLQAEHLFDATHYFAIHQIILVSQPGQNEPPQSGLLNLSAEVISWLCSNSYKKPYFSTDFPAKLITTPLEWDDLVMAEQTLEQIEEIRSWVLHSDTLMNEWGFQKKLKPGYKSLFYGPPGTGKTLVACLLGKLCQMDVYRIDLSMIVSKYIGETEKNLSKVFQMAESKNWILFFDEADALFGKRTGVNDAHDRYANQETSYLLQRIEDFNGLVVLATNLKNNIDEAFSRRFQSVIYFPIPQPEERLRLWERSFSAQTSLEETIDMTSIARQYELAGGTIMNIVRYCSLSALASNERIIRLKTLENGIRRELMKEGKVI